LMPVWTQEWFRGMLKVTRQASCKASLPCSPQIRRLAASILFCLFTRHSHNPVIRPSIETVQNTGVRKLLWVMASGRRSS
jgi:hypothetical protein